MYCSSIIQFSHCDLSINASVLNNFWYGIWGAYSGYLLTYLLTYSMVQSPSWDANWFAASQEIPRISRNSKVHYRTHKRPPPVPILGQPHRVHIPTSHLLEIHPNIIHPSTPRSPQWSLSLQFPHPFSSPIRATCPYLSTLFNKKHDFRKKKKLFNMKCMFWLSLQLLPETFLILRRIKRDIIKNVC